MKRLACGLAVALIVTCSCTISAGEGRERPGEGALKAGDAAPDFTLKSPDGKESVTLASFKGQEPVVLVFASYT
jgi:peroxiredoxin